MIRLGVTRTTVTLFVTAILTFSVIQQVAVVAADDELPTFPPLDEADLVDAPEIIDPGPAIETNEPPREKIIITEIMQNPSMVWDSLGEWFELYNAGNEPVSLEGWVITDEVNNHHVIQGPLVVPAAGYVVVGRNALSATNGGVAVDYSTGLDIFLFNSSDRLVLYNDLGQKIDRVAWDDGATFPDPNGASMSLTKTSQNNAAGENWCVSTTVFGRGDLGTPGTANSCATGVPLVISEIMQNPNAVSDVNGDWFEIHNPNGTAVDMSGWTIKDDGADSHVVSGSLVIPAGGYVVVARNGDMERNGGAPANYVVGGEILFHNNFDELILIDPGGVRIDRVRWDDGRTFPDPTGASMALRNLTADNASGANWCRSTTPFGAGDLGTPSATNTCDEPTGLFPMAEVEITEIMTNPLAVDDNDGEWFEIYNHESTAVDIDGWTIRDFDTNLHTIDNGGPLLVPANGYVVLGRNTDQATNGGVTVDYAYGRGMVLYNETDEVVLVDPNGTIVDQVVYDDGLTYPDPEGAALALSSLALRNDVGAHWCVASTIFGDGDAGSPGAPNTCGPREPIAPLVINEVMQNPAGVPDSVGEWFELHNPTDEAVDINGWIVRDDDYNLHVIDHGTPLPIEPNGFLVLGRSGNTSVNGGAEIDYAYGSGMVLFNGADELVLVDSNYVEVDRIEWDDGASFPDPVGASMSLIDPGLDNSQGSNWCVSAPRYGDGERGTPGTSNECGPACYVDGLKVTVAATPDTLWPPNGRLRRVSTSVHIEAEEPDTMIRLVDVVSDEEDFKKNKKSPDIVIIDDYTFKLRAERNGYSDGRTYTITYEVTTACGQTETFSTTVQVPHDQGKSVA